METPTVEIKKTLLTEQEVIDKYGVDSSKLIYDGQYYLLEGENGWYGVFDENGCYHQPIKRVNDSSYKTIKCEATKFKDWYIQRCLDLFGSLGITDYGYKESKPSIPFKTAEGYHELIKNGYNEPYNNKFRFVSFSNGKGSYEINVLRNIIMHDLEWDSKYSNLVFLKDQQKWYSWTQRANGRWGIGDIARQSMFVASDDAQEPFVIETLEQARDMAVMLIEETS